jgi:molybdopterin synthase sulfur carrier subunit
MPTEKSDMVRLRFFASLRETLGVGDEQLELPEGVSDVATLTGLLQNRGETWNSALADPRLHVAINQEIVKQDAPVIDGDEIAWFPPVTGG